MSFCLVLFFGSIDSGDDIQSALEQFSPRCSQVALELGGGFIGVFVYICICFSSSPKLVEMVQYDDEYICLNGVCRNDKGILQTDDVFSRLQSEVGRTQPCC